MVERAVVPANVRLQFTYGEGPCLQANRTATILRAGVDRFKKAWPIFYADALQL